MNSKLKIAISYPPLESKKGTPCLGQNRQFQWFNDPTYIYPVIPAYAASLLKEKGYEVFWDDAIAEELNYSEWLERIIQEKPDIIAIETKTPVVEMHWKIINDLKNSKFEIRNSKFVLMGDHATAFPEESLQKSKVDYVIVSGDYDFMLLNLANHLSKKESLEGGFWFRDNGEIKNSGPSDLSKHNLNDLPLIDRQLTQWKNYAYKNGNFKYKPGAYMMSGRDCWWGRCTFCLTKEAQILTQTGSKNIDQIKIGEKVLTHSGEYRKVNKLYRRNHKGEIVKIKTHCLLPFNITPNHKMLCLLKDKADFFKKNKKSKLKPIFREAGKIKKGDFLAVPVNNELSKEKYLDIGKILKIDPVILKTAKKISEDRIKEILILNKSGLSERKISQKLNLDRETVHRYKVLEQNGCLDILSDSLNEMGTGIKFKNGKSLINSKITLSKDLFRLFGYYLAEGHVSKLKSRPNSFVLGLTFSQKETFYIEDVKKIVLKSFNIKPNVYLNKKNNTCQITIGNSLLAKLFENMFGDNCYNKNLPEFVLKAEKAKQIELLRGLFRGDAHLRKRKNRLEYILSTASQALASQVVGVLFRCGAIPSIRKSKLGKKMTCRQNIITLSSKDIFKLFPEDMPLKYDSSSFRDSKGFIANKYVFLPVTKVLQENFSGKVYNLSVEKDHSYTVNFVGVSNCSWTTFFPGKNFRTMSAEKALDEVENLINLGVREIMEDSGSLPIGQWLKDFCQGMIERGYNKKVVMSCNMRITGIRNLETWQLMKKAGFRFILFGLESANQITLDRIDKNLKVEEIEPGLKLCKEGGLEPHITTMIGYPWETKEMAQKTIDLAKKLFRKGYVDTLQGTIVIPYPGTPLYKYCDENDLLTTREYSHFDQREMIMKSPLTSRDTKELVQGLYKSFLTPKFFIRKIISIRSWDDIKFIWMAGWKVLGHLTDFKKSK